MSAKRRWIYYYRRVPRKNVETEDGREQEDAETRMKERKIRRRRRKRKRLQKRGRITT